MKTFALLAFAAVSSAAAVNSMSFTPLPVDDPPAAFRVSNDGVYAPGAVGRVTRNSARQRFTTDYNGRYVFTRVRFEESGGFGFGRGRGGGCQGGRPCWAHDLPDAEYNFSKIISNISYVRPTLDAANVVSLDEERIFEFPILYLVEPGSWEIGDKEVQNLREYLLKGGFLIIDDMVDEQWGNLGAIMQRVFPDLEMLRLDGSEAIFDSFFAIDPRNIHFGTAGYRGDQIDFWGIFEDNDKSKRLMVVIGNRGDLGEFWEFSDRGYYPVDISNEAYKVGVNYIVYAMTH